MRFVDHQLLQQLEVVSFVGSLGGHEELLTQLFQERELPSQDLVSQLSRSIGLLIINLPWLLLAAEAFSVDVLKSTLVSFLHDCLSNYSHSCLFDRLPPLLN